MSRYPSDPQPDVEGDIESAVDWLGNRFAVGDPVIYCVGAGRGQLTAIGVVRTIRNRIVHGHKWRPAEEGERADQEWTGSDGTLWRRVKVPTVGRDITVQVLTHKTTGGWDGEKRTRPAWVNPLNITAVHGLESAAIKVVQE